MSKLALWFQIQDSRFKVLYYTDVGDNNSKMQF